MDKLLSTDKQSSVKNELYESLEEIILLLGITSNREIEMVKEYLSENKNDLIKTIKDFLTFAKQQQIRSEPNNQNNTAKEERKETLYQKLNSENKLSNNFSLINEYPEIQIYFKVKSPSNFISSYEERKENILASKSIEFSKEFMEKVKESFFTNGITEEENQKSSKVQNKSKFEKKAQDFKKNLNKKRSNFNNQQYNNANKNNNQKYGNNSKENEEDYFEVNYLGESNNSYNNIPGYTKKNSNYNKNKGYNNNNAKSKNFNNGYGNEFTDANKNENINNYYKNGGFYKKNNSYGKNKHYN